RHRRSVGNEDRLDSFRVRQLKYELPGPVHRGVVGDDLRRREREFRGKLLAHRARKVGHPLEFRDAPLVNPAVELPGMKTLVSARVERGLELAEVELGEVRAGSRHAISRICYEMRVFDCSAVSSIATRTRA